MTNEEYVRNVWQDVDHSAGIYRPNGSTLFAPCQGFEAAAEFTRDRLEQVRQLREEIALLRSMIILLKSEPGDETAPVYARTIARLEAELARLTQGMKPEALQ